MKVLFLLQCILFISLFSNCITTTTRLVQRADHATEAAADYVTSNLNHLHDDSKNACINALSNILGIEIARKKGGDSLLFTKVRSKAVTKLREEIGNDTQNHITTFLQENMYKFGRPSGDGGSGSSRRA